MIYKRHNTSDKTPGTMNPRSTCHAYNTLSTPMCPLKQIHEA